MLKKLINNLQNFLKRYKETVTFYNFINFCLIFSNYFFAALITLNSIVQEGWQYREKVTFRNVHFCLKIIVIQTVTQKNNKTRVKKPWHQNQKRSNLSF